MRPIQLSASILAADLARLGEETSTIINAGADYIHFDVMDHHFVPNLTFGPSLARAIHRTCPHAKLDVHLMVDYPTPYFEPFAKAGAELCVIHRNTVPSLTEALNQIESLGMKPGIAINPNELFDIEEEVLKRLKLVLIMGVYPGFGGQEFIPETLDKLKFARKAINQIAPTTWLGIDGGVKLDNKDKMVEAGADFLVVGTGLFHATDYQKQIQLFKKR